jgi:sugar phosphate isomerase/epimerase
MGKGQFRLSAFGDEISDDLEQQLTCLAALGIGALELRGVWGKNVLHLSDAEADAVAAACARRGIAVSAIGAPVGKSPLAQPLAVELANLARIFAIARRVGTRLVRVFSFYPPEGVTGGAVDGLVAESAARLAALAELAHDAGMQLVLENEHGIVGDTLARCAALLAAVDGPNLSFAWDPANFVHSGEMQSVTRGWDALGSWTRHVHIKDYAAATGEVLPAGEGDGEVAALLAHLDAAGYDGFLALEPHLLVADHSTGFSGPEGMARAAAALRKLMAQLNLTEVRRGQGGGA